MQAFWGGVRKRASRLAAMPCSPIFFFFKHPRWRLVRSTKMAAALQAKHVSKLLSLSELSTGKNYTGRIIYFVQNYIKILMNFSFVKENRDLIGTKKVALHSKSRAQDPSKYNSFNNAVWNTSSLFDRYHRFKWSRAKYRGD